MSLFVCVFVCVCVCVFVCARVCVCLWECLWACVCVIFISKFATSKIANIQNFRTPRTSLSIHSHHVLTILTSPNYYMLNKLNVTSLKGPKNCSSKILKVKFFEGP